MALRRTKILATLGPSSDSNECIEQLILNGVNLFRLNFSHGDHGYHSRVFDRIKTVCKKLDRTVGILQDICGPKVRVGKLAQDFKVETNDKIIFHKSKLEAYKEGDNYHVSINKPEILDLLKVDEFVYLCDGALRTKVIAIDGDTVTTNAENAFRLSSNKGVNFPNTRINIDILTEKDKKDIAWGVKQGVDFIAISFVQTADDIKKARRLLQDLGGKQSLIAKIEKFDACENIDAIIESSDGIMIARGDLGIEIPYHQVPIWQKKIIQKTSLISTKPVIVATQMLLSMAQNESATRAETSDVANAVLDGTDCVMLSEESAVGINPVNTVQYMNQVILAAESILPFFKSSDVFENRTDIVATSTVKLAQDLNAQGIFALSSSGLSVKEMSKYRGKAHIFAMTHDDFVARQLTLYWGVTPGMIVSKDDIESMTKEVLKKASRHNFVSTDNLYIITSGYPVGEPGTTNLIKVLSSKEIKYYLQD